MCRMGGGAVKTVKEVSELAGVSVRTLHHYDAVGLLKPTQITEAGYRLYDEAALERLCLILVYRELGLSLREIGDILRASDSERNRMLEHRIQRMKETVEQLQSRIGLASTMQTVGVKFMSFESFDAKKMDEYSEQAKMLYGKTEAYREDREKSRGRSREQTMDLGTQVMDFFVRLGQLRPCEPDCEAAQSWAKELQAFFTEHFYTCTPQILKGLAEGYAGGGSMNENIDKAGGPGTGAFAKRVIDAYVEGL